MVPTSGKAGSDEGRARGRPLDPGRDEAILRAALEGLADLGYDLLSMEEIAARAGVGKGALYRRWTSKADLVVGAMIRWRDRVAPITSRDTGSLKGDFDAMVAQVPEFDQAAKRQMAVLLGLVGAASRNIALRDALAASGFQRPRQAIRDVLERAASRGEVRAEADVELIPDLIMGLNLLRIVLGEPPDRAFVARIVDNIILPLVAENRAI